MAGLRAGLISFSCWKCQESPFIKESLGCEKPLETAGTWLGPEEEFFNCPIQFIMASSYDFIEKYDAYKNGLATPPDYENQSAKFLSAVRVFDGYISKFNEMKQGK